MTLPGPCTTRGLRHGINTADLAGVQLALRTAFHQLHSSLIKTRESTPVATRYPGGRGEAGSKRFILMCSYDNQRRM